MIALFSLLLTSAHAEDVMVLSSCAQTGQNVYDYLLQSGAFRNVTLWDANLSTPTMQDLAAHDVVFGVYNCGYQDATLLGDNLATFVDNGGGVVLPSHDWGFGQPAGRFATSFYSAFDVDSPYYLDDRTLGAFDAGHPIMQGVRTYQSGYYNAISPPLTRGAQLIASYADGGNLIAVKQPSNAGWVVSINDFGANSLLQQDFWDVSSDGQRMWVNAALFAAGNVAAPPFAASTSGRCPGAVTLSTVNGSPNGEVVALTGRPGTSTIPSGRCAGTTIPLNNPMIRTVQSQAANGTWSYTRQFFATRHCGDEVVFIDMTTCDVATATMP